MKKMLQALRNNDGLTLRGYKSITYKTGYQVADCGIEAATVEAAVAAVESYNGNCGIWYSDGIYYVDHSFRIKTKKEALTIGRAHQQISILKWSDMSLVYC